MSLETVTSHHIAFDDQGRAVVAGTTVKVIEVALDQIANGWSPAEIFFQHDRLLSMAQIHAALSYYYENQAEFDAEIARQLRDDEARHQAQVEASTFRRRLKSAGEGSPSRTSNAAGDLLRLYLDEHVPLAIVHGLRLRGVEFLTVKDDGLAGFPDAVILDRATTIGHVVYTQDDDLLDEAVRRGGQGIPFAGVVHANPLRLTVGRQIDDLRRIATFGTPDDFANRVELLPL